jgi:hypothetical protein
LLIKNIRGFSSKRIKLMPVIKVLLNANREKPGHLSGHSSLTGLLEFGPIPCLGRGLNSNQSKENGDTPTGKFEISGVKAADNVLVYGPNPRLKLRGLTGDAKKRDENYGGDAYLRIHGGRQSGAVRTLKRTKGCLRVLDYDMNTFLQYLIQNAVTYPIALEVSVGNPDSFPNLVIDLSAPEDPVDSP